MLDVDKNTVEALNQVKTKVVYEFNSSNKKNILFIGNSITYHEEKKEIGWMRNCGMAASKPENDYVHQFISYYEKDFEKTNYAICNFSFWELGYYQEDILEGYESLLDIKWDLVIIKLNGNVKRETLKLYDYYPAYKKLGEFFKKSAKQMIFVDSFWPYDEVDSITCRVALELGEKYVHISDISSIDGAEALGQYEHPGVCMHPSDYGMELIAKKIYQEFLRKD